MLGDRLRVMSVMAHPDDFEFCAGGTFALLRETLADAVDVKIVTTTAGASGHHVMTLEETAARRKQEQLDSAALIDAEYECLTGLDGAEISNQVFINQNLLGGLWNLICAWGPDVIFCPPLPRDTLAGVHVHHVHTADAVRKVAYQLCAPRCYPITRTHRTDGLMPIPVIINVQDHYAMEPEYHIIQDISSVFEKKIDMSLCHVSQVFEWLPHTAGNPAPTPEEARQWMRERVVVSNRAHGFNDDRPREYFVVTRWGIPLTPELAARLFPKAEKIQLPPSP